MSKYKERAKKLIDNNHLTICRECICSEDDWLKAMCQLAEEVEIETKNSKDAEFIELRNNKQIFTKLDVKKLLQGQRELSYQASINDKSILDTKLKVN